MGCGASRTISEQEYQQAVRQLLTITVDHAIATLGAPNAFFKSETFKITFPDHIKKATDVVAKIPFVGDKVGEIEEAMNHAAENSVSHIRQFLVDAIKELPFTEVVGKGKAIICGAPDSATLYLKHVHRDAVLTHCVPIVKAEAEKVKVLKLFDDVVEKIPDAIKSEDMSEKSLIDNVVNKTLDAILTVMTTHEKEVRRNPNLRTTALVAEVFAGVQ